MAREQRRLAAIVAADVVGYSLDGDDLYGDGVNVATRLEGEAPAGGIVLSGDMHNFTASRVAATFEDLGRLAPKSSCRYCGWAS